MTLLFAALPTMNRLVLLALVSALCLASRSAADDAENARYPVTTGYGQIEASLAEARRSARESGKLLMVILGADWCHDSRAFIDFLDDPALAALIEDRYVVERVNVGFYDHVRDVLAPWDIPVIYGTPTVLVVEPHSDTVLNRDSLSYWRSADALGAGKTVPYFEAFRPGDPPLEPRPSPILAQAFDEIDAFEQSQAERLYLAYADLGARLRTLGDAPPDSEFLERWDNVAAMRSRITEDLRNLRREARFQDEIGAKRSRITEDLRRLRREARFQDEIGAKPIRLSFPEYDLYID